MSGEENEGWYAAEADFLAEERARAAAGGEAEPCRAQEAKVSRPGTACNDAVTAPS